MKLTHHHHQQQDQENPSNNVTSIVESVEEIMDARILRSNSIHLNNNNNNNHHHHINNGCANMTNTVTENSTYPNQSLIGERGILLGLLRRILKRDSVDITNEDPSLKVIYLGNVVTSWAKTEGCLERPASALWRNHSSGRGSIKMTVTVSPQGLKAQTTEHGLTEYWSNRLTWTGVPQDYPKLFCWIYRHEGRKLKQELRCHAVLCRENRQALMLANTLRNRLAEALFDFRREKILRQNARLSIVQSLYQSQNHYTNYLHINSQNNYKQPLEKARSAPKLTSIEELLEEPSNYMMDTSLTQDISEDSVQKDLEELDKEELEVEEEEEQVELEEEENVKEPTTSNRLSNLSNSYSQTYEMYVCDDQGSSNSDPVNCDSDSQHEEHEDHEEFAEADNISDESGYEELNNNNNSNINTNTNTNTSSNHNNNRQMTKPALVVFDNLAFQI